MEWSNFNGVVRFSNGGNSSDGRLNAATVQSSIGTRITSYQLTISPLRTPPPRSPMPDPPFQTYLYHHQEIYRNLPTWTRPNTRKNYQLPPRKNTLRSIAYRSLPQRMNQSYLYSKASPHHLLLPHYLQSSVFVESCKVSSGKHEYAYQSTILTLRFPRPAHTPRRDKIDRTRYFEFRI